MIRLRLPALRERREDIPALTRYFLQKSAKELGVEAKRITDAALARLTAFDFPGNVRQLENICHWLTVMAPAQVIEPRTCRPSCWPTPRRAPALPRRADRSVPAARRPCRRGADAPAARRGRSLPPAAMPAAGHWLADLRARGARLLEAGAPEVWDTLTRQFEAQLIHTALEITRGRRIEAAQKLGIGRNTITRKIQELGLDD